MKHLSIRRASVPLLLLLAACSGEDAISADTTCKDYLKHGAEERHDAANRLGGELTGEGNPMWGLSLDGACAGNPDLTIRQYFRH